MSGRKKANPRVAKRKLDMDQEGEIFPKKVTRSGVNNTAVQITEYSTRQRVNKTTQQSKIRQPDLESKANASKLNKTGKAGCKSPKALKGNNNNAVPSSQAKAVQKGQQVQMENPDVDKPHSSNLENETEQSNSGETAYERIYRIAHENLKKKKNNQQKQNAVLGKNTARTSLITKHIDSIADPNSGNPEYFDDGVLVNVNTSDDEFGNTDDEDENSDDEVILQDPPPQCNAEHSLRGGSDARVVMQEELPAHWQDHPGIQQLIDRAVES